MTENIQFTDSGIQIRSIDAEIKFIKADFNAQLPTKNHEDDNCWDLYSVDTVVIPAHGSAEVPVGLKLSYITPGFGLAIKPRSGLGFKYSIQIHAGEIDNGYRGLLGAKLYNVSNTPYTVQTGDRVAQFKVERVYTSCVAWTTTAAESTRGEQGFGSSGK